ncbi:hypothetical protein JK203_09140 [Gluconobacter cerinus]|uniref:phosphorylase family protein n=1 Tax=Gluconobacter cerinus TaxID=38307 RepID=UPI001B8D9FCD|nr:hypothetical protein [Gluconobacter cerinus]MBS1041013.1 hypothetical protein [Gluconobacter cerinus]MBS1047926.1 hypothetical protein [Gluconobacter cerinus]
MLGVLVGMKQEARIIRRFLPDAPIALSNATASGAVAGAERLLRAGATRLLSFGCAGGLSTSVKPGTIIVADCVVMTDTSYEADAGLSRQFGADHARQGRILHSDSLIETAEEKSRLYETTGCIAVDMESGAVARTGKPFAVLRVVCDDSARSLPPAARDGLKDGAIHLGGLLSSLVRQPSQIPALIELGKDAAMARKAMALFLEAHPPQL